MPKKVFMTSATSRDKTTFRAFFSVFILCLVLPNNFLLSFAYIFASESNGVDLITHPIGYTGTGGAVNISIGIDPTSANASDMVIPVQNVIYNFNLQTGSNGNLNSSGVSGVDFESVLLHEMGHSLGLAHVNAATESGLTGSNQNYTKATNGANNSWCIDNGSDNIIGSEDDVRGDDINMCYFRTSNNNPFTIAGTVDNTTYSREVANLPGSDNYSVNGDRTVGADLGYANSECVMQQGTFFNETQRELGFDDLAGLQYAMAGVDEVAGTADDYTLNLTYAGLTTSADIVIDFDNSETSFAVSQSSGAFISATHLRITSNSIYFNTGYSWVFNTSALFAELLDFVAIKEDRNALLKWSTGVEINHSHFELERSYNLKDWDLLEYIWEEENELNGIKKYEYSDMEFENGGPLVYYRLKIVDLDGSFEYSDIRILENEVEQPELIAIAPVPLELSSYLSINLPENDLIILDITNIQGQQVYSKDFEGFRGLNKLPFGKDINLPAGTYLLRITVGNFSTIRKIVR